MYSQNFFFLDSFFFKWLRPLAVYFLLILYRCGNWPSLPVPEMQQEVRGDLPKWGTGIIVPGTGVSVGRFHSPFVLKFWIPSTFWHSPPFAKIINAPTFIKKVHLIVFFALEPAKHCNCDQWIVSAINRLLQTIPPAAGPYRGTDNQLQDWMK